MNDFYPLDSRGLEVCGHGGRPGAVVALFLRHHRWDGRDPHGRAAHLWIRRPGQDHRPLPGEINALSCATAQKSATFDDGIRSWLGSFHPLSHSRRRRISSEWRESQVNWGPYESWSDRDGKIILPSMCFTASVFAACQNDYLSPTSHLRQTQASACAREAIGDPNCNKISCSRFSVLNRSVLYQLEKNNTIRYYWKPCFRKDVWRVKEDLWIGDY